MAEYPEHEKLRLIKNKSQACGDFYEWLQEQGYVIASRHVHTEGCTYEDHDDWKTCGMNEGELFAALIPRDSLLAKFFEIDQVKIEKEKLQMLEELRAAQKR